jgi:hypothetical protein
MTERLTPSELVYLFVDGEATGAERTEMYAALANDNDLQAEFEDALRLKQTVDEEIAVTTPPFQTTRELFLKAGFTLPVPIAGGEALAPAVSHIAESGIFTALKSLIAPFFVTTGIIATGIVSMPFFERIETHPPQQPSATPIAQVFPTDHTTNAPLVTIAPVQHIASERNTDEKPTANVVASVKRSDRSHVSEAQVTRVPEAPTDIIDQENATIENVAIPSVAADAYRSEQPAAITFTHEPYRQVRQLDDLRREPAFQEKRDLWFGARGITGIALYPSRLADGAKDLSINNIALSAEYQITPTSRIGLAAGTETFPHYTINADTSLTEKWNIVWAGASYTLTGYDYALGPFVPSVSLLIGGAGTGPLAKVAAGLSWQPDDRVSFTGGIESTGLLYHFGSAWRIGGKLGATYSVAVRF